MIRISVFTADKLSNEKEILQKIKAKVNKIYNVNAKSHMCMRSVASKENSCAKCYFLIIATLFDWGLYVRNRVNSNSPLTCRKRWCAYVMPLASVRECVQITLSNSGCRALRPQCE